MKGSKSVSLPTLMTLVPFSHLSYFQMDADADIQTVIKKEDFDTNPWSVDDASVFLKYNCPECDYNDGSLKVFSHHALENHDKSKSLFDAKSDEKNNILSNVKCEMSDEDIQGISYYFGTL